MTIERETKGNRNRTGYQFRVVLLLGLVCTLMAGVFGSTLERSIRAHTEVAYTATPPPGVPATAEVAMRPAVAADTDLERAIAPSAGSAEPLLLLLLGSMLFCVAFGVSIYASRTEAE